MIPVLLQMAALIACGLAWRALRPGGLDADATREALTGVVYHLLLPALVLAALWGTPLDWDAVRIAFLAATATLAGLGAAWLICRGCATPRPVAGAVLLAAAFPNVTYLGLPVLEHTLGPWSRTVVVQYDLFAVTPLLLSVGLLVARSHGTRYPPGSPAVALVKVPPLWAALAGMALTGAGIPPPAALIQWLQLLAAAVVPLMLIAVGMGLRWDALSRKRLPLVLPVLVIQLLVMPLLVLAMAPAVGLSGDRLVAVVLEAAMPSMVLGMVLADRYGLDGGIYAMAVTVSTACSLLTLPLWFAALT